MVKLSQACDRSDKNQRMVSLLGFFRSFGLGFSIMLGLIALCVIVVFIYFL